jgi:hypothetical protein
LWFFRNCAPQNKGEAWIKKAIDAAFPIARFGKNSVSLG